MRLQVFFDLVEHVRRHLAGRFGRGPVAPFAEDREVKASPAQSDSYGQGSFVASRGGSDLEDVVAHQGQEDAAPPDPWWFREELGHDLPALSAVRRVVFSGHDVEERLAVLVVV